MKYNEGGITDPTFGLQLWYQEEVNGNVLWAFNYAHLIEIKNYVSAQLGERSTTRFSMTMGEKLPSFIKSAKNRDEVLQALEQQGKKTINKKNPFITNEFLAEVRGQRSEIRHQGSNIKHQTPNLF